jgi:hypothetical protein
MFRHFGNALFFFLISLTIISCEKETSKEVPDGSIISVVPGTTSGSALFFTSGGLDSCTGAVINGVYETNIPLDNSNTVEIEVNVTRVGDYTIKSGTTNGVFFSAQGTFTVTGKQRVTLVGNGIPLKSGVYWYMAGARSCRFKINFIGGPVPFNCKECAYTPMCDGSVYSYSDTSATGAATTTQVSFSQIQSGDTVIDGMIYKRFLVTNGLSPVTYYNCTSGITTMLGFNVSAPSFGGVTVPKLRQTILKANAPVGASWVDSFDLPTPGVKGIITWEVTAKNISHTILGQTYNDVIKMHMTIGTTIAGTNITEGDFYYAKLVGLIDNIMYDAVSVPSVQNFHRILMGYNIP